MEVQTPQISFLALLGLLFIGLKLGSVIDWSWWLVLLPFYGPALAFCVFFFIAFLIAIRRGH